MGTSSALAAQSPRYTTFGAGCSGSLPASQLIMVEPPVIGGTLRVDITNVPANAAFMVTGLSRSASPFGPLPLWLDVYGMSGCVAYISPDATRLLLGTGNALTYTKSIPQATSLVGFRIFEQALVLDPGAGNAAQCVISDAAEVVIGLPGWPTGGLPRPNMVAIASGAFQMGSTAVGGSAVPVHSVTISQPFWVGRYEVSQAEYQAVMGGTPSSFGGPSRPVENISWAEATTYCLRLSLQEDAAGRLPFGYQYRLPTEAEWEYCCRAGTTTEWNVGGSLACGQANHNLCVGQQTTVVGSYPPNAWGLHDMHGNVWEWCLDSWDGSANYPTGPVVDPQGTSGTIRVQRGGGWDNDSSLCRSAFRGGYAPTGLGNRIGFRVVLAKRSLGVANMVPIAAGSFQMGSAQGLPNQQPAHVVNITRPFWMGKYEVTQAEYQSVMNSNPSGYLGANRPVESLAWNDAMNYCAALTTREAAAGRLPFGYQYRLPTEAEWEYCCRAGTTTEWNVGSSLVCAQANFAPGLFCVGQTAVVGTYPPNAWGLHDMHGNVWEWCLDSWDGTANYPAGQVVDPYVTTGNDRILRGASWDNDANACRSFARGSFLPTGLGDRVGFRIVLGPVVLGVNNMVPIAAGAFQMGSTQGLAEELPVHTVNITRSFWMGKYEVTQAEYQAVMNSSPSTFPGANRPVEGVTWNDAVAYCAALTTRESAAGRLPLGYRYRLPTEAEWEYCCRAGTATEWNVGNSLSCSQANIDNCGVNHTSVVGSYAANAWGLYDMHGNVGEWCLDSWNGSAYPAGPVSDPLGTSGPFRVGRGGDWLHVSGYCRSAYRYAFTPLVLSSTLGFRVVLAPIIAIPVANMIPIAPGSYSMGSTQGQADEQPVHVVTITRPFWMGKYEVNQAEYQGVMGSNPSFFQGATYPNSASRPVERVDWSDAMNFCAALTVQETAAGHVPPGYQYRLPTEAEWEYCCRAGTTTEWNVGSSLSCSQANFYNNGTFCVPPGQSSVVGIYAANPWGLRDMHGNVMEWCLDSWDGSVNYPSGAVSDPYVNSGPYRVIRGGGWDYDSHYCRSAYRSGGYPGNRYSDFGFRVVLAPVLTP